MKLKDNYFYTIREDIKDEESNSGNLLVKAGMIKKTNNGIYMYLPLGQKVLQNIEKIVREEMNKQGALELAMPHLISQDYYQESGRLKAFGQSMFKLNDRYDRPFALGPTHEELFVKAASAFIKSYKDMPFNIYQIGTKYRDEVRPRLGLIRTREFTMKDAYSFDTDLEMLDKSYSKMYLAYKNIFDRVELDYKIVKADTGAMGGFLSEEFQAITDTGEDILVLCPNCNYASNLEISKCLNKQLINEKELDKEAIYTPNVKTIEEVSKFLNINKDKIVKTLIYKGNNDLYACLVPGDRDINEVKLAKLVKDEIALASDEEVLNVTTAETGYAGPIGLSAKIVVDEDVVGMNNFVVGANKKDYHYINVNIKDFKYDLLGDIKMIKEGDLCPNCKTKLAFKKGIEVGNIFKLGTKYSESLDLKYLDKDNNLNYVYMGCYGIGIQRIMASIVEQKSDDKGIIWPYQIAPYKVAIVIINNKDENIVSKANELYDELNKNGIDTLLDDRDLRAGVKFNDMDLIGIPYRIVVGSKIDKGLVEFKKREEEDFVNISIDEVLEYITKLNK